jgi:hypothetical protein
MNRVLDQAKQYISLGWEVLPIHRPLNGKCSCDKEECSSSGKHLACKHGFKDASKELKTCTSWFEKDNRNIGIKTGKETGLLVLVIDPSNDGNRTLDALEEQHGRLPETLVAETGGGGLHYYFNYPKDTNIKSRSNVYPGIDIKADSGYVVAEPSIHSSGQPYLFIDTEEVRKDLLLDAPNWLLETINEGNKPEQGNHISTQTITQGSRHMRLLSIGGKLRRCGLDFDIISNTLSQFNKLKCSPPLEDSEINSISKSLMKYPSSNEETIKPKLSEKALAGPIGSIIKKLEGKTEAHPAALLAQLLCAYGNALGVNPHFKVGPSEHRCGIYMCVVGSTAKARKGLSWGIVKHFMSGIDKDWTQENIQSGLSSSEGLIFKLSNQIETSKDPRMLVIETEFASVLLQSKRNGNTLSSTLRDAWDGAKLQTLTKSDPILAEGYHFSIVSHITKVELDKLMSEEDKYNGLANRFLWVFAERTILISNPDTIDLGEYSNEIKALKRSLNKFYKKTDILFSKEAIEVWDRMYHELSSTGEVLVDAVNSRDESYLRRIAMIYAIADDSITIKTKHLESALAFIEYAKASTNYIFGGSVLSKKEQKLFDAIKNSPDSYSRTQAHKLFNNHVKADGLDKLLSKLEDMNLISSQTNKDDDSNVLYYAN